MSLGPIFFEAKINYNHNSHYIIEIIIRILIMILTMIVIVILGGERGERGHLGRP